MSEGNLPDWMTEEDDGSITVSFADLKKKPKLDGTEVSSLTLREPTVADELAIENIKSFGQRECRAIANLTEQSPEAIGGLTMRQYGRLQDAYGVFFRLTEQQVRVGALRLARHTGWAEAEIMAMPVSRFIWWLEGLPKQDAQPVYLVDVKGRGR